MPEETDIPYGRRTQKQPKISEVHVLWLTAGMSCDGDTVSITAASAAEHRGRRARRDSRHPEGASAQPVLAYENGDEFMQYFHQAANGRARSPSSLVIEGSIPNENIKRRGLLGGLRHRPGDRPADPHDRMDRPARAEGAGGRGAPAPARRMAAFTRWRAIRPGAWGLPDYLGWEWRSKSGLPIVNVPGCPVQPDNFMETLLYLLHQRGGPRADDPARRRAAADVAVRPNGARRLRPRGLLRAGRFRATNTARANASSRSAAGDRSCNCNVPKRGWMRGIGGCPNVGGICIGCTMPGFPDKFMPFMDEPPGAHAVVNLIRRYGALIRKLRKLTDQHGRQGAEVAPQPARIHHRLRARDAGS